MSAGRKRIGAAVVFAALALAAPAQAQPYEMVRDRNPRCCSPAYLRRGLLHRQDWHRGLGVDSRRRRTPVRPLNADLKRTSR